MTKFGIYIKIRDYHHAENSTHTGMIILEVQYRQKRNINVLRLLHKL